MREERVAGVRASLEAGGREFDAGPDAVYVYGPDASAPGKMRVSRIQVLARGEDGNPSAIGPSGHHTFAHLEEAVVFMVDELKLDGTLCPGRTQAWMLSDAWDRGIEINRQQLRMQRWARELTPGGPGLYEQASVSPPVPQFNRGAPRIG